MAVVTFRNILKAYSGSIEGLTYYYNSRLDRLLCRKHIKPKETIQNRILAEKSKNLSKLDLSEDYIQDLKTYAILASNKGKYLNWRNVLLKMMYALEKAYPSEVNLCTITKSEIYAIGLPCVTVSNAVMARLLEEVIGYERLNSEM